MLGLCWRGRGRWFEIRVNDVLALFLLTSLNPRIVITNAWTSCLPTAFQTSSVSQFIEFGLRSSPRLTCAMMAQRRPYHGSLSEC